MRVIFFIFTRSRAIGWNDKGTLLGQRQLTIFGLRVRMLEPNRI